MRNMLVSTYTSPWRQDLDAFLAGERCTCTCRTGETAGCTVRPEPARSSLGDVLIGPWDTGYSAPLVLETLHEGMRARASPTAHVCAPAEASP